MSIRRKIALWLCPGLTITRVVQGASGMRENCQHLSRAATALGSLHSPEEAKALILDGPEEVVDAVQELLSADLAGHPHMEAVRQHIVSALRASEAAARRVSSLGQATQGQSRWRGQECKTGIRS